MNWSGLAVGLGAFLIIGLFHPIVIKTEYHCGTRPWWVFLAVGIAAAGASLWMESEIVSALLGVFAFCCWWSIKELFEQRERVKKGWFPKKEKK